MSPLSEGFRINRPILSSVTNYSVRQASKASNKSFIWSEELYQKEEIISTQEGKVFESEPLFRTYFHKSFVSNHSCFVKVEIIRKFASLRFITTGSRRSTRSSN
jgi:hypothetical protein